MSASLFDDLLIFRARGITLPSSSGTFCFSEREKERRGIHTADKLVSCVDELNQGTILSRGCPHTNPRIAIRLGIHPRAMQLIVSFLDELSFFWCWMAAPTKPTPEYGRVDSTLTSTLVWELQPTDCNPGSAAVALNQSNNKKLIVSNPVYLPSTKNWVSDCLSQMRVLLSCGKLRGPLDVRSGPFTKIFLLSFSNCRSWRSATQSICSQQGMSQRTQSFFFRSKRSEFAHKRLFCAKIHKWQAPEDEVSGS